MSHFSSPPDDERLTRNHSPWNFQPPSAPPLSMDERGKDFLLSDWGEVSSPGHEVRCRCEVCVNRQRIRLPDLSYRDLKGWTSRECPPSVEFSDCDPLIRDAPPEIACCPVAVIVACHNYGRFLEECLSSILNQTVLPSTILVVDDASTDETRDVCRRFPEVDYLRVEFRHAGRARKAGLQATREPYILCVDADNWLEPDYLEEGLKNFTDRTIAGVYSDYLRFGLQSGITTFPEFQRGELFRANYIDTCSILRRDALDLIDWVWEESPLVPEDHLRAQALVLEGWRFKKQAGLFHYRCHAQQMTERLRSARSRMGYPEQIGLTRWPLTLFIPLSGRLWAWKQQSKFLDRQRFPHHQLRLILCDTSDDPVFSAAVRYWLAGCDYHDVRHMQFPVRERGLADKNRCVVSIERDVNLAMCRIYNRLRTELQTELVWILEDDVIPPDDVLARLLAHLNTNVACVSAAYHSRYDGLPLAWTGDAVINGGTPRCAPRRRGVEPVRGTGFGCLLLRSELLRQHVFSLPPGVRYYDPEFFKQLGDEWIRLCDWSCWCRHLDPTKPQGYV